MYIMEVYKKRYDVYDFPFSVRGVVEMGKQGRVYTLFPFILELVGNLQKIFFCVPLKMYVKMVQTSTHTPHA